MNPTPGAPTTSLATSTADDVFIRDRSLCRELIGKVTFTEMLWFGILGQMPSPGVVRVVDACLVTLMEHGLTPSAVTTRLVYSSSPESMQAAVGAGLSAVGSLFVGTMEGCGALLRRMLESPAGLRTEALSIAQEHRAGKRPLPGFGHPQHKPDDPRTPRLLELARAEGIAGQNVEAVLILSAAIDEVYGKHITLNVTGAVAALLGDAGAPYEIMRGFAIIARSAGLVAHVHEEQRRPSLGAIWEAADRAVPYDGDAGR